MTAVISISRPLADELESSPHFQILPPDGCDDACLLSPSPIGRTHVGRRCVTQTTTSLLSLLPFHSQHPMLSSHFPPIWLFGKYSLPPVRRRRRRSCNRPLLSFSLPSITEIFQYAGQGRGGGRSSSFPFSEGDLTCWPRPIPIPQTPFSCSLVASPPPLKTSVLSSRRLRHSSSSCYSAWLRLSRGADGGAVGTAEAKPLCGQKQAGGWREGEQDGS